jgi:tetratricopeptide (TPR) repeat protein
MRESASVEFAPTRTGRAMIQPLMRERHRVTACVALALACGRTSASEVDACVTAAETRDPSTRSICMHAWEITGDMRAAVGLARDAWARGDYVTVVMLSAIAPPTIEGAKILHFWGEMLRSNDNPAAAEAPLRRALELRRDVDPLHATNTALVLLALIRSNHPADETIEIAYTAWDQALRSNYPLARAMSAAALIEVLVDLGELQAAQLVLTKMSDEDSRVLYLLSEGRLQSARGRTKVATALFARAAILAEDPSTAESTWRLDAQLELVQELLRGGHFVEASKQLEKAETFAKSGDIVSSDAKTRLPAAHAALALAHDDTATALRDVEKGLASHSRDATRVLLLNIRGDALARDGQPLAAERAWHDAADEVETWRASIPSMELRAGLVPHQRHALEAWLDSSGARGDADAAVEVAGRILGRALLDRLQAGDLSPTNAVAAVQEVEKRLADRRGLGGQASQHRDLRMATHDLVAILDGAASVWAIRRRHGYWSVERVGSRSEIATLADALRRDPDSVVDATRLGEAMFPSNTLPDSEPALASPLAVALDRSYADLALPALRVGGRYLVEYVAILELLVPDLIFVDVPVRQWHGALAIGDPVGNLPGASRELERVGRQLSARVALGARASRSEFIKAAMARTLHVATHSTIDNGRAAFVLGDGIFTTHDIVKLRIAPRLAVIATCRSQTNDDPEQSLVAAFLAAGSTGVVGVKRAIDDADGERFMADFYDHHGDEDPVTAVAEAQRVAIAANRPPHTWAAFSFFGTGGWLATKEIPR